MQECWGPFITLNRDSADEDQRMEVYAKTVIPVIESNYGKLTTVERNIADFFIENRTKMDFSARAISEQLFVSEASL